MQNLQSPPVIAIVQIPMHWEPGENVRAMKQALRVARNDGASLCAFSELAVTGFHRRIVDWAKPEISGPAVDEVRLAAAQLGIAAVFGAPTYAADGTRFNSHLFVAGCGSLLGSVSKIGLTEPEATFFAPGEHRGTFAVAGMVWHSVFRR